METLVALSLLENNVNRKSVYFKNKESVGDIEKKKLSHELFFKESDSVKNIYSFWWRK